MRLFYRKKMLENRHFLIGIFQHFTTVADTRASEISDVSSVSNFVKLIASVIIESNF